MFDFSYSSSHLSLTNCFVPLSYFIPAISISQVSGTTLVYEVDIFYSYIKLSLLVAMIIII